MMEALCTLLAVALYGVLGRVVYLKRWPDGLLPPNDDTAELERIRRVGRRRVRPVPSRPEGQRA